MKYARNLEKGCDATPESVFYAEASRQREANDSLLHSQGTENPVTIWKELGALMTEHVTVVRYNANLQKALNMLDELSDRFSRVNLADRTQWSNQTLQFTRELGNMLILSKVITMGALARNETRGAHYKPEFPERDDKNWLKTTKASYNGGKIKLDYEPVDISLLPPRSRKY